MKCLTAARDIKNGMAFYAAAALFAANFVLGVLVKLGVVGTFHWLHHGLFFLVCVSAVVAVFVGFRDGRPYRWALLPTPALFVVLPAFEGGSAAHITLACTALVFYAAGFVSVLQEGEWIFSRS
jgi:hypothetical protein